MAQLPPRRLPGTVIIFVAFLAIGSVIAWFPPTDLRLWGFVGFGLASFIFLLVVALAGRTWQALRDLWRESSANQRNTAITIYLTVPLFTFLYWFLWWPQLREPVINTSYTPLGFVPFPAVTILQKTKWPTQADLFTNETYRPECYLGYYDPSGPQCSGLTPDELSTVGTCQCTNAWDDDPRNNLTFDGSNYTYFHFRSAQSFVPPSSTFLMLLKVSFFYNIKNAIDSTHTRSTVPSPGLFLAIFDQKYSSFSEAVEVDQTRLIDINALGTSSINLDIEQRTNGSVSNYYYGPTISSVPAMNIVCNTSTADPSTAPIEPCTTFLILRIPGSTRLDVKIQKALNWGGLIASAGSFYSIVQILAWVFSGAASESDSSKRENAAIRAAFNSLLQISAWVLSGAASESSEKRNAPTRSKTK